MTGFLAPWYFEQFRDDSGRPLANGYISTFVAESDVPKPLYYDINLQNPCPNPLPLNSAGYAPEFFLTSGAYTFAIYDKNNVQIARREPVIGAIAGGYGEVDTYKVMSISGDDEPDYLFYKLINSDSVVFQTSGNKVTAIVTSAGADTYQIKTSSTDNSPGFLGNKILSTDTINLSISANKLKADYIGPQLISISNEDTNSDYLGNKLEDSEGIQWEITSQEGGIQHIRGNLTSASDTYKIKVTSSDTPDYISNKLFGGTGIVLSEVEDESGKKLYISTTSNINSNGKVKVTSAGTLGYLTEKIVAGTSINLTNSADTLVISFNPNIITSAKPFTSAVTVSSTNAIGLIAITLSAGLWELTGGVNGYIIPLSGAQPAGINCNINTSITFTNDGWEGYAFLPDNTYARTLSVTISPKQYTVSTSQTIYLVAQCRFGNFSSCQFWGNMIARKIG